jgi:hypothetical protein
MLKIITVMAIQTCIFALLTVLKVDFVVTVVITGISLFPIAYNTFNAQIPYEKDVQDFINNSL